MRPIFFGVADILDQCAHFDGIQHDGAPLRLPVLGPRPLRNATYFVVGDLQLIQGRTYMCLNSSQEVNLPSMLRVGGRVLKGRIEESIFTVAAPDGPFEGSLIGIFGPELILRDVTSGGTSGGGDGGERNTPPGNTPVVPTAVIPSAPPVSVVPSPPSPVPAATTVQPTRVVAAELPAPVQEPEPESASSPAEAPVTPTPAEPVVTQSAPIEESAQGEQKVEVKAPKRTSLKVLSVQTVLPFPEEFTPEPGLTASIPAVETPARKAPAPRPAQPVTKPEIELTLEDPASEPSFDEVRAALEKTEPAPSHAEEAPKPAKNLSEARNAAPSKSTATKSVAATRPVNVRTAAPTAPVAVEASGISDEDKDGMVF